MARIALIDKQSRTVVNVIEAAPNFPNGDPQIEIVASDDAEIGWHWDGRSFVRPAAAMRQVRRMPPPWQHGFRNDAEVMRLPEERQALAAYAQARAQIAWLQSWDEIELYRVYKLLAKLTKEKSDALKAMDGALARLFSRIESGELASIDQIEEALAGGPGIPQ